MPAADFPSPQARVLYEAHVAFEVDQWRARGAAKGLRREVDAFWRWAARTPLQALGSVDNVQAAATRLALDIELPEQLARVIGAIADDLIRLDVHAETRVEDIIDETLFNDGVSLFIELEDLRNQLIRQTLASPVCHALASDVLFQGIKDYVFSESGAMGAIPGFSSFLKGSSSAVGKRLPGLEAQVEKRVRAYIRNNTARILASSEATLLDSLDEARIRAIAAEIWAGLHDRPLAVADVLDCDDLQKLIDYALRAVKDLRETDYVRELIDQGVRAYFAHYGDKPIADLLAQIGVNRDVLRQEAEASLPAMINGLDESGLFEDLIRQRLEPFYQSDAFVRALGSGS